MCNPASLVVTKARVFWSNTSDSHEDIIEEFGLSNFDREFSMNLVRVEITPPGNNYQLPVSQWKYKVDQDLLPKWYDAEKCETRARIALNDWIAEKVVMAGQIVEELTTYKLFVFGTVQKVLDGGTVQEVWCDGTVQKVSDGGTVQKVRNGGTVQEVSYGGTVQEVWNGGTVQKVRNGGTVQEVSYGGTVQKVSYSGTVQEVSDGGTVQEVWNGGTVQEVSYGGTVQKVSDGGTVIAYTKLDVSILKHKNAVLIDRSGDTVICYTGLQNQS